MQRHIPPPGLLLGLQHEVADLDQKIAGHLANAQEEATLLRQLAVLAEEMADAIDAMLAAQQPEN